jgi:7,8-dihydroneopterin aldolase/epimerase/oxygenase
MSVAVRLEVGSAQEIVCHRADWIHVENLCFHGKHGVGTAERSVAQPFSISVKLGVDIREAAQSDMIEDTSDYSLIKNIIRKVVEEESHRLVERMAERIVTEILLDKRIRSVELSIKKLAIWDNGIPGVTIVRERI